MRKTNRTRRTIVPLDVIWEHLQHPVVLKTDKVSFNDREIRLGLELLRYHLGVKNLYRLIRAVLRDWLEAEQYLPEQIDELIERKEEHPHETGHARIRARLDRDRQRYRPSEWEVGRDSRDPHSARHGGAPLHGYSLYGCVPLARPVSDAGPWRYVGLGGQTVRRLQVSAGGRCPACGRFVRRRGERPKRKRVKKDKNGHIIRPLKKKDASR